MGDAAKDQRVVIDMPQRRRGRLGEPALSGPMEPTESLEAVVDGRRVVIEAADEIVIRCGKSSITLRRNGRVVIRGSYVETDSEGVNRIKGGAVKIN